MRPVCEQTLRNLSAAFVKLSPQWTYPLGETNPAKTRRCAFACGGRGGHTPDPMPGRERERAREREEPFSGSVSRVPLRFGSGAVRFCAVRLLRFRFGSTAFLKEPRPKQAKSKHQNASRWVRQRKSWW